MLEILKSVFLLWFLVSNTLCEDPQWPDLRCHPGYVNEADNMELGQGRMAYATEYCKNLKENPTTEDCFKRCMLEETFITKRRFVTDKLELKDKDDMILYLSSIFFSSRKDDNAMKIANRIISMCSNISFKNFIVKESEHIACADKVEVYKCLEDAWGC